jgi:hypothetical protein
VKLLEALKLEFGRKLVRCVEKQRKLSLRCSSPRYFIPFSPDFPDDAGDVEYEAGMNNSALISWRGDCESGRRNWCRKSTDLDGLRSVRGERTATEGSISDCAF